MWDVFIFNFNGQIMCRDRHQNDGFISFETLNMSSLQKWEIRIVSISVLFDRTEQKQKQKYSKLKIENIKSNILSLSFFSLKKNVCARWFRNDFGNFSSFFSRNFVSNVFCIAWPNVNPKINPNIIKYIVWSREKKKRLLIENKKKNI